MLASPLSTQFFAQFRRRTSDFSAPSTRTTQSRTAATLCTSRYNMDRFVRRNHRALRRLRNKNAQNSATNSRIFCRKIARSRRRTRTFFRAKHDADSSNTCSDIVRVSRSTLGGCTRVACRHRRKSATNSGVVDANFCATSTPHEQLFGTKHAHDSIKNCSNAMHFSLRCKSIRATK